MMGGAYGTRSGSFSFEDGSGWSGIQGGADADHPISATLQEASPICFRRKRLLSFFGTYLGLDAFYGTAGGRGGKVYEEDLRGSSRSPKLDVLLPYFMAPFFSSSPILHKTKFWLSKTLYFSLFTMLPLLLWLVKNLSTPSLSFPLSPRLPRFIYISNNNKLTPVTP